ncbi:protein kinase and PP2C-like domain-containing protein isoform X4 [Cornus florida]|uniref:protein kinase and PP2C-like domain-containing protein isoform X4 n=1 Tax=Cornus florida TaxID=4283 RepID=UPI00289966E5|nr:protein kinase and PP2C-like domain-containing protein isoform X4 [Cornus florida]
MVIVEPNTCIRGCCRSESIPLHLPPSSYSLSSPIARGAESVVYEATLDGKKVAVKKPILSTSEDIDRFHKELQLLCNLDHPGIATLVAAHAKPPNYMFFFKFYESGNLAEKLHVQEWRASIDQSLTIIVQLAKALQFLHNLGIVHRDVKPANILLDENLCPHLADFGLAEYKKDLKQISYENWRSSGKPTGGFHKKNMVGTLLYMAPEILRKEIHTEKSDVFSFGVLINELLTGVVPYTDLRAEAQAHTVLEMNYTEQQLTAAVVSEGLRPILCSFDSGAPAGLLSLIQRCWDAYPEKRPSFGDIVLELDPILEHRKRVKQEENALAEPSISPHDRDITNHRVYQESINWFAKGAHFSRRASLGADSGMRTWLNSSNDPLAYYPALSWGSFATCGRRETMEDTHFLMPHLCNEKDIHVFGIFDGHRGSAAAEFSACALPGFLQTLGSTRRTIVCRTGGPCALSKDHVASCLEERERVIKAGGQVKWQVDTWRVGAAALQVTRSIGDDDLKPAVTAEPEITETILSLEDEYLVIASDGLWDVMDNAEVVSIIKDTVKEPGMCSKRLATEAAERGSKDNITVIVVFLRPVSTAERIY